MPTTVQFYKGDDFELKWFRSVNPITQQLETAKDEFFAGAYSSYKLGEVLYDSGRAPLSNAIPREIFREAFASIFDSFLVGGGLESYLTVFRNIFGADVEVEFTIPGPGQLNIDIQATGSAIFKLVGRTIVDNAFVRDYMVDRDGNNIAGRGFKGFETQDELETMLFEMVPAGIYTLINLTVGGA